MLKSMIMLAGLLASAHLMQTPAVAQTGSSLGRSVAQRTHAGRFHVALSLLVCLQIPLIISNARLGAAGTC